LRLERNDVVARAADGAQRSATPRRQSSVGLRRLRDTGLERTRRHRVDAAAVAAVANRAAARGVARGGAIAVVARRRRHCRDQRCDRKRANDRTGRNASWRRNELLDARYPFASLRQVLEVRRGRQRRPRDGRAWPSRRRS
jgi:hypothetical protein